MKWIGRIIYILLVSFTTLFIFRYGENKKHQAYFDEHIAGHLDDDAVLLKGINTLLGVNYYREDPLLYQYVSDQGDYQFKLTAYAVGIAYEEAHDGMMFILNNLKIYEDGELVIDPLIKIHITLSDETLLIDKEYKSEGNIGFDPHQPFSVYNVPALFLFETPNYLEKPTIDAKGKATFPSQTGGTPEYATITSITVKYSNRSKDEQGRFIFNDTPLFIGKDGPINEPVLDQHKDENFQITHEDFRLKAHFSNLEPNADELALYHLNASRDSLKPYNRIVWQTMIIYTLSIAVITYFIFFHKMVREKMQSKKETPNQPDSSSDRVIFKDE